jgi:plastocyanin
MQRTQRSRRFWTLIPLAALLIVGATIGGNTVLAQDSADGEGGHPAHLHAGTCAELGDVVFPLADIGDDLQSDGTPMAADEAIGPASAIPVKWSTTTVEAPLADIVDGGHALNVHESAENIGNYIACGDVGGTMMGDSDLAIGLAELNDSGHSGVARFHDNGDGTTTVTVYLLDHEAMTGTAGAETPDSAGEETAAGAEVEVDISGFAYNPQTIEISVGDTVTWTNNDSAPHTVTQSGGGFQSGRLDQGATFSHTFTEAGSVDYFCEFHAGMTGTVVVN